MTATSSGYAYCASLLRDHDRDSWLAALFVPEAKRRYIHALYAFAYEIARVRDIVSEPRLGEIRLQWWREVLEGERAGEAAQNPACAALLDTFAVWRLPASALTGLIEAHRFDLYSDPMPTMNDLEGYCGETCSSLFLLTTLILSEGAGNEAADACGHAGVAFALTSLLRRLPWHIARGQCFLPKDVLDHHGVSVGDAAAGKLSAGLLQALSELRSHIRIHLDQAQTEIQKLSADLRPAFVPLAVIPVHLKVMERTAHRPFTPAQEPAQWRRQWAMWRWPRT